MKKQISIIRNEPDLLVTLPLAFVVLVALLIMRPLVKFRVGFLRSDRIGHFAANTELYLCDQELTSNKYIDIFYFGRSPCNKQLAKMWARELIILPRVFLRPLDLVIRSFNFLANFKVIESIGGDRDINDIYGKTEPHLSFTKEEINRGESELRLMGIPEGKKFICITARDSAYLKHIYPNADTTYQNYRDSDIQNYVLAAETLTKKGYYVIRMGAVVNGAMNCSHPMVIDYATNGMRSDFMDIYLGAHCDFCITTQTGFDAVPIIFRRPIVHVNAAPLGYCYSWGNTPLVLSRHHIDRLTGDRLTLSQVFSRGVGYCVNTNDFQRMGVILVENSPEEIRDIAIEMAERLDGSWKDAYEDEQLQELFWRIFPKNGLDPNGIPLHGVIKSRYGANFLRENQQWLK